MSAQALKKQLDDDRKVSHLEEVKKMSEKTEIQVHKQDSALYGFRGQTVYLEKAGAAISSLGDLIESAKDDSLDEYTVNGVGHLLQILGEAIIETSIRGYECLKEVGFEDPSNRQ